MMTTDDRAVDILNAADATAHRTQRMYNDSAHHSALTPKDMFVAGYLAAALREAQDCDTILAVRRAVCVRFGVSENDVLFDLLRGV